ncbi:MAG: hypothetical protein ACUVRZ_00560, partial [Desulfobacca sp.]|uniref:hypothetical protein n=1 Tax=Desulfobacca sp. TaxID=2067990 RepID=UPI0040492ECF
MKAASFDTLEFAKRLREAEFTEKQAETLAFAVAEVVESRLATKEDLARLQHDLEEKITLTELRLKHDLTLRLGGMLAAAVAIV